MRAGIGAGLVVLCFASNASAQLAPLAPDAIPIGDWLLTPVLEGRMRGEYRHDLDGRDRGFLLERARLGADVQRGPLEARVVLQDVRLWDLAGGADSPELPPAQAVTGAYEVWAEAHTSAARPAFVRVGRQPVSWGEGRLLGVADGSPTGRTLDALRGRLPIGDGAIEVLGATLLDFDKSVAVTSSYGELFGARVEWQYHPLFAIEGYFLARIAQAPLSLDPAVRGQTYTGALRLHGDSYAWTWGVEGAVQLGNADDLGLRRLAFAGAGHVARTFERAWATPSVRVGGSYASGDGSSTQYQAFDPLLPDVRVWHGAMDLFGWTNEIEGNARVAITPFTDAVAAVEYRYVRLAQASGIWRNDFQLEIGRAPNGSPDLGHEVDASLSWSPWTALELSAGYSFAVLGDGARNIVQNAARTGLSPVAAEMPIFLGSPPSVAHFAFVQASLKVF